jgi:hypothetical protein
MEGERYQQRHSHSWGQSGRRPKYQPPDCADQQQQKRHWRKHVSEIVDEFHLASLPVAHLDLTNQNM